MLGRLATSASYEEQHEQDDEDEHDDAAADVHAAGLPGAQFLETSTNRRTLDVNALARPRKRSRGVRTGRVTPQVNGGVPLHHSTSDDRRRHFAEVRVAGSNPV